MAVVVERLRRTGAARVVLESIGGDGRTLVRALAQALAQAGFEVVVVDPRRIKALRTAEGGRAKTDRLDARLIARFALIMTDAARPVPSAEAYEIRALSTRRRQLVELAAMEKTRLKQALDPEIADSCRAMIARLSDERSRIEARLQARLDQTPDAAENAHLLRTIPGVGPAVAMTLLADLPELGALDQHACATAESPPRSPSSPSPEN